MVHQLLAVSLGGSLGALLRFGFITLANPLGENALLFGALAANLLGCMLIGLLWMPAQRLRFSPELQAFTFAGFLGSLTTFSTFGLVSIRLFMESAYLEAIGYILASNIIGLALVYVGLQIGKHHFAPASS